MDRRLLDYRPVLETFADGAFGLEDEWSGAPSQATVLGADTEMALAVDLLGMRSERELDRFLSELMTRVGPAGAALAHSPVGKALAGALKRAALSTLPLSALHGGLAQSHEPRLIEHAARVFGLELEGLSPEDKEFAVAQQFIRFAGQAAKNASYGKGDPHEVTRRALHHAALKHAPGLHAPPHQRPGLYGRWVRTGNRIVVLDC